MSYTLRTMIAAKAGDVCSRSTPNLHEIAMAALRACAPTIEIKSNILEGAIQELARIDVPAAHALVNQFASVR